MTGGRGPYRKGYRAERALVLAHAALGIEAIRSPMSRGIDLHIDGIGDAEVKARAKLPATISRWLGDRAVLFVRPDRSEPAVLMSWAAYARLTRRHGA
jgi:Holliday junction resolvase